MQASRPMLSIAACIGMSFWKRRRIAEFLSIDGHAPRFVRSTAAAIRVARAQGGSIAVWNSRKPHDLEDAARDAGIPVVRIEDGFLRSVGLGANFTPAASIVLDHRGIYYDPAQPSDLEVILNEESFEPALLLRARCLIDRIVKLGITKYNSGGMPPPRARGQQNTILVPGQVEDDGSVVLGGAGVRTNLSLLQHVRAANPDACIWYKPHPDVVAGHRPGALADRTVRQHADHILRDVSCADALAACDEVHTITSLSGFEALLRGKAVTVYGRPFYAGWGLTRDLVPQVRRGRRLNLEQLAAGALILYPRYLDPVLREPCTPERLVERLSDRAAWTTGPLIRLRRTQGALMKHLRHAL